MHPPRDEQPEQLASAPLNRRLWIIAGSIVVLAVGVLLGARLDGWVNAPHKTGSSRPAVTYHLAPAQVGAPIPFSPNPENAATAPLIPPTVVPTPPTTEAP